MAKRHTIQEIATTLGYSYEAIRLLLKRHGVRPYKRPRGPLAGYTLEQMKKNPPAIAAEAGVSRQAVHQRIAALESPSSGNPATVGLEA